MCLFSICENVYDNTGYDHVAEGVEQGCLEDSAFLSLLSAGRGGNGNALRGDDLASGGSGGIGCRDPYGIRAYVFRHAGLQLSEKDVGRGVAAGEECSDGSDGGGEQGIECS